MEAAGLEAACRGRPRSSCGTSQFIRLMNTPVPQVLTEAALAELLCSAGESSQNVSVSSAEIKVSCQNKSWFPVKIRDEFSATIFFSNSVSSDLDLIPV